MAAYGDQFNFQTHQFADPSAGLQQALGAGGLFATTLSNMVSNDKDQIQLARQGMEDQQRQQTFDNAQTEFNQRQEDIAAAKQTIKDKADYKNKLVNMQSTAWNTDLSKVASADQQNVSSADAASSTGDTRPVASSDDYTFKTDPNTNEKVLGLDGKPILIRKSQIDGQDSAPIDRPDYNIYETNAKGYIVGVDADGKNGKNLYEKHADGKWYGAGTNVLVTNQDAVVPNKITDDSIRVTDSSLDPSVHQNKFVLRNGSYYQFDAPDGVSYDPSVPVAAGNADAVKALDSFGNASNVDATDAETAKLQQSLTDTFIKTSNEAKYKVPTPEFITALNKEMFTDNGRDIPEWASDTLSTANLSQIAHQKDQQELVNKYQTELASLSEKEYNAALQANNVSSQEIIKGINANSTLGAQISAVPNEKNENVYQKQVNEGLLRLLTTLGTNADQTVKNAMVAYYNKGISLNKDPGALENALTASIGPSGKFTQRNKKDAEEIKTWSAPDISGVRTLTQPELIALQGNFIDKHSTKNDTTAAYNAVIANSSKLVNNVMFQYEQEKARLKQAIADANKGDISDQKQEFQNNFDKFAIDNISGYTDHKAQLDAATLKQQHALFDAEHPTPPVDTGTGDTPPANVPTTPGTPGAATAPSKNPAWDAQSNYLNVILNKRENSDPYNIYHDTVQSTGADRPSMGPGLAITDINKTLSGMKLKPLTNNVNIAKQEWNGLSPTDKVQYQKAVDTTRQNAITTYLTAARNAFSKNGINPDSRTYIPLVSLVSSAFYQYGPGSDKINGLVSTIAPSIRSGNFDKAIADIKGSQYYTNPVSKVRAEDMISGIQMLKSTTTSDLTGLKKQVSDQKADAKKAYDTYDNYRFINHPLNTIASGYNALTKNDNANRADMTLSEMSQANSIKSQISDAYLKVMLARFSSDPYELQAAQDHLSDLQKDLSNADPVLRLKRYNDFSK